MLAKGWIKPSVSPYGSPVLFFLKKAGELQMCIDFCALNSNTKLDVFLLPCIADFLDRLGKAKYFSSIDLATAYHQVRISKVDIHKNAFFTKKGLYEYVVIPFELCNAPVEMHLQLSKD